NNMAIAYENQGQIEQAEKLFRQAAQTWKECGDSVNEAVALGNLADIFMGRGELRRAEEQYQSARRQIELTDSNGIAYGLYSIAVVGLYQGDTRGANQFATRALSI